MTNGRGIALKHRYTLVLVDDGDSAGVAPRNQDTLAIVLILLTLHDLIVNVFISVLTAFGAHITRLA